MRGISVCVVTLGLLAGCAAPAPAPPAAAVSARFAGLATARGVGVPLASGLVLTAAHVVDEASLREELCRQGRWPAAPVPYLSGLAVDGAPATRLRQGQPTFAACDLAWRGGRDLALLRPAAPLPGGASLCPAEPPAGAAVAVATPAGLVPGRLAGEAAEADPANGRYTVLAAELDLGASGAGAFAAGSGCLLGIVSMRDPTRPGLVWLVRLAVIRAFLDEE